MKFTALEIKVNHEQESDYETAVDMSHSSLTECNVRLKAETGAVLVLNETNISTHYSYLEPDFDQFEEDGTTVYLNHASEDPTKDSRTVRGHVDAIVFAFIHGFVGRQRKLQNGMGCIVHSTLQDINVLKNVKGSLVDGAGINLSVTSDEYVGMVVMGHGRNI